MLKYFSSLHFQIKHSVTIYLDLSSKLCRPRIMMASYTLASQEFLINTKMTPIHPKISNILAATSYTYSGELRYITFLNQIYTLKDYTKVVLRNKINYLSCHMQEWLSSSDFRKTFYHCRPLDW